VVHLAGLAAGAVDGLALAPPVEPRATWRCRCGSRRLRRHHLAGAEPRPRLLLSLPALAALAAFALPTFSRSASALIDWFTLLFFSGIAFFIWFMWVAIQTGFPAKPAANVARLAPGFVPSFGVLAFAVALLATIAWIWLVRWRTSRSREAIWKSLVLPAGGTALAWLLATTLVAAGAGLRAQLRHRGRGPDQAAGRDRLRGGVRPDAAAGGGPALPRQARPAPGRGAQCLPLAGDAAGAAASFAMVLEPSQWTLVATIRRPTDRNDNLLLYRKKVKERGIIARHAGTVLAGQLATMAFGITDTIVAGRYSQQALAALSVGSAVFITVFIALLGTLQALLPTWAELHGAGRKNDLGRSVRQALYLAGFACIVGVIGLQFPGFLLHTTDVPAALEGDVRSYLAVLTLALPPALLFRMFSTLNQSLGKPQLVTWLQLASPW
jgi:hypothetical protein